MYGSAATFTICALLGWYGIGVSAQISFPSCKTGVVPWAFNKENQSPCQVAAVLQGVCFSNSWHISEISPGKEYSGPSGGQSNACQCNTVAYSLVSACGACQKGSIQSWIDWRKNCSSSQVTIAGYPLQIPPNTNVPAWAYLDVTKTGNMWDPNLAQTNAASGAPESTGGSPSPSSASKPISNTSLRPSTPTTSGSSTPSVVLHGSSRAGAIAGGVVGGVVGVAALILIGFILYRKSYRPKHTAQHVNEKVDIVGAATPVPTEVHDSYAHNRTPSNSQPKLYNPSDPSTFPPSPFPAPHLRQSPYGPLGAAASSSGTSGYKGIPEV